MPMLILHTGVENLSWGPPVWTCRAQPPWTVQEGDLVQAELFRTYGGIQTQQQMAVATKPVHSLTQELADIARRSYEVGLEALRRGKTFGEVYEAMKEPISEAGCWHLTPLIHSINPLMYISPRAVGLDQRPEIKDYPGVGTIEGRLIEFPCLPGMIFQREAKACRGKSRVNIGGTVAVTEDGVEELNELSTEMRIAE